MKYILLIACMAFATLSFAQDAPAKFQELKHSFGKIKKGVPVTTEFKFTNTSSKPLIIEVATAECGCTTPEYPKTPVMAGKESTIKVTYNAESEGHFEKKVTVKFAKYAEPVILEIDGDVAGGK
ncbi:DUF1573 domain-containing protein [Ilyomonas limi]|uniref:DUF1573 domain-containing protein n=1 Tax=Ilyomonas limi TaxID=2575867 RepID=A0A4V5UU21_9BACT|nr:DUF1573 domain-containing protein [Ilyomonas limi]TKK65683.1 DUF1573 domain-containing protein [Ilyomonas limi]